MDQASGISGSSPHWKSNGTPSKPEKKKFKGELAGVGWSLTAALTLLAFLSYHPQDPSLNTVRIGTAPIHNYVGVIGAYSADFFLQLFGLAAFGLVFVFLMEAIFSLKNTEKNSLWLRFFHTSLWLTFGATLTHWFQQEVTRAVAPPYSVGGIVGLLGKEQFYFWLGRQGGLIALFVLFFSTSVSLLHADIKTLLASLWRSAQKFSRRCTYWVSRTTRRLSVWVGKRTRDLVVVSARATWQALRKSARRFLPPDEDSKLPVVQVPTPVATRLQNVAPMAAPLDPTQGYSPEMWRGQARVVDVTPEDDPILAEAAGSVRPRFEHPTGSSGPTVNAPFQDDAQYELPHLELLEDPPPSISHASKKEHLLENSKRLTQKLAAFGIHGTVEAICPGPVITMYEFKPKEEVKISRIANLSDDLSLALSAESVRIIAPIPGKSVVGIEIPNENPEPVFLKEMLTHSSFLSSSMRIPVPFGKDIAGEPFVADLTQMPHLLVAGSTGSGKSVFINTVICSLLFRFTPSQVRMLLIDPKMVELSVYDHIPHLLLPVVTDAQKASLALMWAVDEMERRYELLHDLQVRNIDSYNLKVQQGFEPTPSGMDHRHLPMVVIVVDELADLMMTAPKEAELSIARLAQKARAAGIHLILATQRPDTTVITGTIKANFSSRISFRVSSRIDSSTILDDKGAEKLLGRGDMLIRLTGIPRITRLHGAFVGEREVESVVSHVRSQGEPTYDESILRPRDEEAAPVDEGEMDEVYDRALDMVLRERIASISLVQRRLRIGYNRAARIIETMERQGLISPSDGTSRPRKVLAPAPEL